MDYSGRWAGIQPQHQTNSTPYPNPNPNPNPLPSDPYAQFYNTTQHPPPAAPPYPHYSYYPPNPNPNPLLADPPTVQNPPTQIDSTALGYDAGLRPPGIDPYSSNSYVSHVGFEGQSVLYPQHQLQQQLAQYPGTAVAPYYQDPGQQSWSVKDAIRQFGSDPVGYPSAARPSNGIDPMAAVNPTQMYWNTHMIRPFANGSMKRGAKKTKVVQSAWCELCMIDCNSKEILDQHKLGKKHRKNLEKIRASKKVAIASVAAAPTADPIKPKRGHPSTTRKGAEARVDLETKRRKLMQGGAAADSVRVCALCNVVCNSKTVFDYHLSGQKHAAQVKKQAQGVPAVGLRSLTAA